MVVDIKNVLLDFIKSEIFSPSISKGKFVVLIVDEIILKIISSCSDVNDLNKSGIGVVLRIDYKREKLGIPAIYMLSPTTENIKYLKKDFKKSPLYSQAHLFFNGELSDEKIELIKENKKLLSRIKSLKEMNMKYLTIEKNVFTFDNSNISELYFQGSEILKETVSKIARHISSYLIITKELPYIRYYNNHISKLLAKQIDKSLSKFIRNLPDWQQNEPRSTLIILDRSFDTISPIMHEFTYKAMAADLLGISGSFVNIESDDNNGGIYIADDDLWEQYGSKYIADVITEIPQKSKEFIAENPLLKIKEKEKKSLKDISKAMKNAPQFKKIADSFSKNISIAENCMKIFKSDQLKKIGQFEQTISTGLSEDKVKIKRKNLVKKLNEFIDDEDIKDEYLARLLMIFRGSTEGSKNDIDKLLELSDLNSNFESAVKNIAVIKEPEKRSLEEYKRNENLGKTDLNLMRHIPKIDDIIKKACEEELSKEEFPYLKDPPIATNLKNAKNGGRRRERKPATKMPTIVFFIAGGASYSEIRCADQNMKDFDRDLILGTTEIITPKKYIEALGEYEDD